MRRRRTVNVHHRTTDYLLKPPKVTDLIRAIERALAKRRLELARQRYRRSLEKRVRDRTAELQQALQDLETTYSTTLWALVAALDAREHEVSNHSQRVVRFTLAIARRLGLPDRDLPDIGRGALLHDIGKIGITDAILLKPGKLTAEEWVEHAEAPADRVRDPQSIPSWACRRARALSPGALRRERLPARRCPATTSRSGPDLRHRRHLRRHDQRPALPEAAARRGGPCRDEALRRHAVRPALRRGLPGHVGGRARRAGPPHLRSGPSRTGPWPSPSPTRRAGSSATCGCR